MQRLGPIARARFRSFILLTVLLLTFPSGPLFFRFMGPQALDAKTLFADESIERTGETQTPDGDSAVQPARVEESSSEGDWPMAAANPERTSWTSSEVPGKLRPVWYRVIEPYIAPNTQIIAANGLLYVSTARGLYALDAATGATAWVFPTELPLGNSPTVFNGVVYVGGYDHMLYAIDAMTGKAKWTYEAAAGFSTNPLVLEVNGFPTIYAGNRDGWLYAIRDLGGAAALLWRYQTGGPILFSAAYADSTVYIASNDARAYALNAETGALVWKSARLPGAGFQAWWPVVYRNQTNGADVVILAGSDNYRDFLAPAYGDDLQNREINDVWPNRASEPDGTLLGARNPDGTVDATRALQYFEAKPWRRTYIVLDRRTGQEITFDFDGDGKPEYAPVLWHGTHSGNRYPPVVGGDGVLYQSNTYMSDEWIPSGQVTGWVPGKSSISTPSVGSIAMDEPMAYSAGGNIVYWSHCNDRSAGAFDISIPINDFNSRMPDATREWLYFSYDLDSKVPGYNVLYEGVNATDFTLNSVFQGSGASQNGVYGQHGYQNPPIPYAGRVYLHRSNAVIAFGVYEGEPVQVPMAHTVTAPAAHISRTTGQLQQDLAAEVSKILAAGHLRPGYRSVGTFDVQTRDQLGDHLIDYWHDPSDTLYTLILALPYLSTDLQQAVKVYLQSEYAAYPPYDYTHVGWQEGAPREPYELPQEVQADLVNNAAGVSGWGYDGWTYPPQMFYALWKYAEVFGSPRAIFDASKSRLETPPSDDYLVEYPYVHNAYIAGYLGYLNLEKLAGYPESAGVRAQLNRLLSLRAATFDKDTPFEGGNSARVLSIARNFMNLVPEAAQYLRDNNYSQVQEAVAEYTRVAPFWFVSNFDATAGEGASQPFFDHWALFQAKALILQEPGIELTKYLDVPSVQVGDLYYIQNLVAILDTNSASGLDKVGSRGAAYTGQSVTYTLSFSGYTDALTITDSLPVGLSAPTILAPMGTSVVPVYDAGTRRISWYGDGLTGEAIKLSYRVTVVTGQSIALTNVAQLLEPGGVSSTSAFTIIANPSASYLPLIVRNR